MTTATAFDVYGTMVDPLAIADHLKSLIGDPATHFAGLWRTKQLEYSFRRGLMRAYQPFSVCTPDSLLYTESALGIVLTEESRTMLMERYTKLPAFRDSASGLASIKGSGSPARRRSRGHPTGAGKHTTIVVFDDVVSAEEVRPFKRDPAIYGHAVSSRPNGRRHVAGIEQSFDVIGAEYRLGQARP